MNFIGPSREQNLSEDGEKCVTLKNEDSLFSDISLPTSLGALLRATRMYGYPLASGAQLREKARAENERQGKRALARASAKPREASPGGPPHIAWGPGAAAPTVAAVRGRTLLRRWFLDCRRAFCPRAEVGVPYDARRQKKKMKNQR
jgi:hypothetical protein